MKILSMLMAGLWALPWALPVQAQDFPAKPIKLIVPFPAGGPNDIIARVVGQRMSELTKQPVVIDNRGGQAGVLGTDAIAKSIPTATPSESSARAHLSSAPRWKKSLMTRRRILHRSHW